MKLWVKILIGFSVAFIISLSVGFYMLEESQQELKRETIEGSSILSQEVSNEIDREIYHRLEKVQKYAKGLADNSRLIKSNEKFENMSNRASYIEKKDEEWKSTEEPTQLMNQLMNNQLSQKIQDEFQNKGFYQDRYGYSLYPEAFVTNRYGVVAGLSSRTSDYYQADEEWWQKAKENGFYIGEIRKEPSTGKISMDLAVRIEDSSGEFEGVFLAVLNAQRVNEMLDKLKNEILKYHEDIDKGVDTHLLDKDRKIIYSTEEKYNFSEELPFQICVKKEQGKGCKGSIEVEKETGKKSIVVHSHSQGFLDYPGQEWQLAIEYKEEGLFNNIKELGNKLISIMLLAVAVGLLIDYWIARKIAGPEEELKKKKKELEKFAEIATGREKRMIELKEKINELREELDREPLFDIEEIKKTEEESKEDES